MQNQHDYVRSTANKYGAWVALLVGLVNVGLGAFLLWVIFNNTGPCARQVPLFLTVAGWTALSYGSVFLLYALVSAIRAARRAGYVEVNNREDSVFGDSVFDDTRDNLAEVARPGGLSSAMGCLMFVVGAFRLAWLIFGSVEVFKSTGASCEGYYIPGLIYVISQWSLIGLFFLIGCCGCVCIAYCASLLGRG